MPYLCSLFNGIFRSGKFPDQWSLSIIFPLHKKGSIHEVNNYCGISLMDICGKIFISIMNIVCRKLLYPECQGGFRKG